MPPSSFSTSTANDGVGNYSNSALQQEWSKLKISQQRLSLQQERLKLEQELLKTEKRNWKRSSKLKSAPHRDSSSHFSALDDQSINSMNSQIQIVPTSPLVLEEETSSSVRELREQLAQAQALLEQKDKALAKVEGGAVANSEELKSLQAQLAATQRSLANVLVEKDTAQHERDALEEQLAQRQPERKSSLASNASTSRCHKCAEQQLEIQQLQDDLQNMKLAYVNAQTRSAQQTREWQLKQQTLHESQQSKLQDWQHSLAELQHEKEALESEVQQLREETLATSTVSSSNQGDQYWKDEAERLQNQLGEQNRQLEDWKLLVPRNKVLLEQATTKQERLQTKYYDMESKYEEQRDLVKELQAVNKTLVEKHESLEQEHNHLREQQPTFSDFPNDPVDLQKENDYSSILDIVIPLDDPSGPRDKLVRDGMKHVVEWEWTSATGLYGMYTGWLDLTGTPHGHGTLRIEDGSIYDGEWKRGLREGKSE
jgi:hypothetical protein